jgi:uncharacterized protein YndB with AHSA1/START domain
MTRFIRILAAMALLWGQPSFALNRSIEKEVLVPAPVRDVWHAWTTNEGARTFFSAHTNIYAKLGAPYEIYFVPEKPYGKQGCEGCRVHSLVPMKLLAFTWNSPPQFPSIREPNLHTIVYLRFEEEGGATRLRFSQVGWGEGDEWQQVYEYFEKAWDSVLGRLRVRFTHGPIDWSNPPGRTGESFAATAPAQAPCRTGSTCGLAAPQ